MLDRRAASALVGHRRIELRMPKAQLLQTRSVTRLGMIRKTWHDPNWPSRGDSNTRPHGSEPCAHLLLSYATLNGDPQGFRSPLACSTGKLPHQMHSGPWCVCGDSNAD